MLFSGRREEVDAVVARIHRSDPGLWTLTGPPGSGKSAVVGRVVSLSDPAERARILADGGPLHHEDPGEGTIHANVHARNGSADDLAAQIEEQLIGARLLASDFIRRARNSEELVAALRRADAAGSLPSRPVVVVDGLDEARRMHLRVSGIRREAFDIAERLLVPLAETAVVLVATRDLGDDGTEGRGLVARLCGTRGPDLDLGSEPRRAAGRTRCGSTSYAGSTGSPATPWTRTASPTTCWPSAPAPPTRLFSWRAC
ncbi:ATP-binding protein [Streptomyces goshikiensis]|uniref:ATP-binding protein n=1 Tax=Streptomyces goshikiensis TaxID=1942 RepID=UPI0038188F47